MHHTIVALEGIHMQIPTFKIPPLHTATQIIHQLTSAEELRERIKDATILISTTVKLTADILDPAVTPNLQLISQLGSGYDNIDIDACKKRGIRVCNTRGGNTATVAEHALALYFAGRRSVPMLHWKTVKQGEWKATRTLTKYMRDGEGMPPPTCQEEICGIVGYGQIGKRIAQLMRALGMRIVVSDRKSASKSSEIAPLSDGHVDLENPTRTSFHSVLKHCTTIIVVCPRNAETTNLISTEELSLMRRSALVVNVARGGIIDEEAMAKALNEKQIGGYASDVFATEPSFEEDTPLMKDLSDDARFVATPHVAWFSETTMTNLTDILIGNVEGFLAGKPQNVVV